MKKLFFVLLAAGLFVACGTKTEKEVTVNQDSLNQVAEQARLDSIAKAQADSAAIADAIAAELAANETAATPTDKATKPATTTQKENTTVQKTVEKAVTKLLMPLKQK